MNSSKSVYGNRTSGGAHGDVFTLPSVVCFMLDKVGYTAERNLQEISILEPSCGEGEFLVEIARRLKQSAVLYGFDAENAFFSNVRAFDIDANKIDICRKKVGALGFRFLENIKIADFLKVDVQSVDIIVGNPPYIRYENIPTEILDYCKRTFVTFYYRSDLYIPFFEKTLLRLKEGGKHCFICSNRWLKNEYGKKLRQYISNSYRLEMLINLEQTDAFQEEVLAYPAISLISAEEPKRTFEYADICNLDELSSLSTTAKYTPKGSDWTSAFVDNLQDSTLLPIEEQGFKIGVGVATGADAVFISENLAEEVERELIIPAINARDLRGNNMQWGKKYLLNPYMEDGKLIDLDLFPKAKFYLEKHREKLCKRHIANKSPERWYRTIDRIVPSLQSRSKILIPDMSGNDFIFVDNGQFYPMHNIYYIIGNSNVELCVLAALLMSDFVRKQLSAVTNKMNGGFSRWQSQHLRKLRLPNIMSISANDTQSLLEYYSNRNIIAINSIVDKLVSNSSERHYCRECVVM